MRDPALLQHHLARTAASLPGQTALLSGDSLLTYSEVDRLSGKIAGALVGAGVGPGDRVAISLGKTPASLVGVYGILKTGAAYVPLEFGGLASRQARVATHSEAAALVTSSKNLKGLGDLLSADSPIKTVVLVDHGAEEDSVAGLLAPPHVKVLRWREVLSTAARAPAEDPIAEDDPAVILYTSGTTGKPKGVVASHRSTMDYVRWAGDCMGLGRADVVSGQTPLHFGTSTIDMFSTCRAGATLVHVPERYMAFPVEVVKLIERVKMTVWYSITSVLISMVVHCDLSSHDLSSLRTVVFAGEPFPPKHLHALMSRVPGARFMNWYGATETYVSTWYEIPPFKEDRVAPIPIGKASEGMEVFAVKDDGSVAEGPGERGVLYVKGAHLMTGYWRAEAETAAKLVQDPRPGKSGLAYMSGDVVSIDEQGDYTYIARVDAMVKSRGYRIEPGAIESAILSHPGVREAAVFPVPDDVLGNRIVAAVVAAEGSSLGTGDILNHCRKLLPGYMVPDRVVLRDSLPFTSTGKVDRIALINGEKEG